MYFPLESWHLCKELIFHDGFLSYHQDRTANTAQLAALFSSVWSALKYPPWHDISSTFHIFEILASNMYEKGCEFNCWNNILVLHDICKKIFNFYIVFLFRFTRIFNAMSRFGWHSRCAQPIHFQNLWSVFFASKCFSTER